MNKIKSLVFVKTSGCSSQRETPYQICTKIAALEIQTKLYRETKKVLIQRIKVLDRSIFELSDFKEKLLKSLHIFLNEQKKITKRENDTDKKNKCDKQNNLTTKINYG